jgi:hypothetical protein
LRTSAWSLGAALPLSNISMTSITQGSSRRC